MTAHPSRHVRPRAARSRTTWFVLCVWVVIARPVNGQESETRAFLEVRINGRAAGEALVVLRADDVLVPPATLGAGGLVGFSGRREQIAGEELVSLESLAPGLQFKVDERTLQLAITAAADLFGESVRNLQPGAPPDIQYRTDASAFLNYAVNVRDGDLDVYAEPAINLRGASLHSTISASRQGTVRGLTNVTVDRRASLQRWSFGDAFATTGALGGSAFVAGVRVAKDFGIAPYYVRYPTLAISGAVTAPSVAEVYVNGRLVARETLDPGRFDLQNVPIATGRNDARVVVRDPFGGTRELSASHYLSSAVLKPGVHDYEYAAGFQRRSVGTESWDYSRPAVLARHRLGITDRTTAGGRLEGTSSLLSLGPTVQVRMPVGEIEASAGLSRDRDRNGGALSASYLRAGAFASAGASIAGFSEGYTTLDRATTGERPRREASVFASAPLWSRGSLSLQHTHRSSYAEPSRWRTSVLTSIRLNRRADLSLTATRARDDAGARFEWFAGLMVQLGDRTLASIAVERRNGADHLGVEAMRPLPVGEGYGYRVRAEESEGGSRLSGDAQYQSSFGRYEVRRDMLDGRSADTFTASGALVTIGGGVYASRPVQNSFGLIRVPGVAGVRAFASNQEVGRTDAGGNLLVPDLLPYYGNVLSIADDDVPLDYSLERVRFTIAPPYRGGALIVFPVERIRAATGRVSVLQGTQKRVPAYGTLTAHLESGVVSSPIGAAGEFYLENLPAGKHQAVIKDKHASCGFTLTIPESSLGVVDMGELQCTVR